LGITRVSLKTLLQFNFNFMQYAVGTNMVTVNGLTHPAGALLDLSAADAAPFLDKELIYPVMTADGKTQVGAEFETPDNSTPEDLREKANQISADKQGDAPNVPAGDREESTPEQTPGAVNDDGKITATAGNPDGSPASLPVDPNAPQPSATPADEATMSTDAKAGDTV
jgi:hypothetical protein